MAKVEKIKTETPKFYPVTLSLTAREAEFLTRLLGWHIVGKEDGWRGVSDSIFDALDAEFCIYMPESLPLDNEMILKDKLIGVIPLAGDIDETS